MEFLSLGGIVLGFSLEVVMLGVSQSRNENLIFLGYFFYDKMVICKKRNSFVVKNEIASLY